jgi:hypothetical protein
MAGCAQRRGGAANVYADHVGTFALRYMRYDIEVVEVFRAYHVGGVCGIRERVRPREVNLVESGRYGSCCFILTAK